MKHLCSLNYVADTHSKTVGCIITEDSFSFWYWQYSSKKLLFSRTSWKRQCCGRGEGCSRGRGGKGGRAALSARYRRRIQRALSRSAGSPREVHRNSLSARKCHPELSSVSELWSHNLPKHAPSWPLAPSSPLLPALTLSLSQGAVQGASWVDVFWSNGRACCASSCFRLYQWFSVFFLLFLGKGRKGGQLFMHSLAW